MHDMARDVRGPIWKGWIVAVIVAIAIGGCGTSPSPEASGVEGPQGSITLVMNAEPETLQSHMASNTRGYPILRNVQEALVNRDSVTNELVPELATSWEQTDPTTWRFELRHGVTFQDGSPFDATAAAFALTYVWSEEQAFEIRDYMGPEFAFEVVDDDTLDVVTETPDPILPTRLYFATIPSMKQLQEDPDAYATTPIGTGPYRFVEWKRGESVTIEPNPDWWGLDAANAADARGRVSIKDVTFIFRAEQVVRAATIESGEADYARWVTRDQCDAAPQCVTGPGVETTILRLDVNNPTMHDLRVRKAIALAIDKDSITNRIHDGGTIASQLVALSAFGFDPSLEPYPFDPDQARALIAEARADGVPVDAPLTLMMNSESPLKPAETSEFVTQALKDIGLNVSTQLLETARFEEFWGQAPPIPPERALMLIDSHGNEAMDLSFTASSYYKCGSRGLCDDELEALIAKAEPLVGEARESAFHELQQYFYAQYFIIPIDQPTLYYALSDRLNWQSRLDGFILLKEMSLK
jgi:peptide/nickel transport system substrate-binding protein